MKLALLFPLIAFAACDGSPTPSMDLAMSDLATSNDLRSAGASCAETQSCIQSCASDSCVPGCIAKLSAAATPYFNALESCSEPACATSLDGGAAPACALPSSQACTDCITQHCGADETACLNH